MPGSDEVVRNFGDWVHDLIRRLAEHAGKTATQMETYAKQTAPWDDQTGQARRSIRGEGGLDGTAVVAAIGAGMEYSPYLEFGTGPRGAESGVGTGLGIQYSPAKEIRPKNAKALRWVDKQGNVHYAKRVNWMGMGPRQILLPTRDRFAKAFFDGAKRIVEGGT